MSISEDVLYRQTAVYILRSVWRMSEDRVRTLFIEICEIIDNESRRRLDKSLIELNRLVTTIISDSEYIEKEQAHTVGALVAQLNHLFKGLLNILIGREAKSLWMSDKGDNPPTWFKLKTLFKGENYGYPASTTLIEYLRNIDQHKEDDPEFDLPLDHITGIRTCGNIYTLVSIFILSIYAYIEILETYFEENTS